MINSPGGSPVQSHQIYLRIRQLAAEKKLPVLVFVEDVAASGGYMIACAGDEIFCDPSSILGSIGVVGGTFGFQELIKKIGVERRLYTAGEHKAMLDPFLPENPDDVARLKALQREIHAIFIALVKRSRGARLKGADDVLFSGEYWAGETSVALGLADAIGDLRSTLARPLRRQGADAGDRAGERHAVGPARPQVAGGGNARALDGIAGLPDEPDFGAGDAGDLGQIRVLNASSGPRPFGPGASQLQAPPALRDNTSWGRDQLNDKDRPMPPLIAFAGCPGWAGRGPLGVQDGR